MSSTAGSFDLDDINDDWQPVDTATLLFIVQSDNVLLIRKKRGLGAGKINGPGGKIDPGETPRQCIIREVQEELKITTLDPEPRGEVKFQFTDNYSVHVYVFTATQFEGTPTETDEADPLWFHKLDIPYREMWADDVIWLPKVLEGRTVQGKFIFHKDTMLAHEVHFSDQICEPGKSGTK